MDVSHRCHVDGQPAGVDGLQSRGPVQAAAQKSETNFVRRRVMDDDTFSSEQGARDGEERPRTKLAPRQCYIKIDIM